MPIGNFNPNETEVLKAINQDIKKFSRLRLAEDYFIKQLHKILCSPRFEHHQWEYWEEQQDVPSRTLKRPAGDIVIPASVRIIHHRQCKWCGIHIVS